MHSRFRSAAIAAVIALAGCNDATAPAPALPSGPPGYDLAPVGMAKPVNGLRDYDGTYTGTPGTGTIGYTTLYRDNEDGGATSQCNGEGCGSHPGVDIPVSSNSPVYASLAGRVIRSECNWNSSRSASSTSGWGGLVVIKSANPYVAGDSVYFTYGHLNKWDYFTIGQVVGTGVQIGKSGGNLAADVCPGNSTGAHLHFQVDRSESSVQAMGGNPSRAVPWFPSQIGRSVHQKDSDFQAMRYTYNPVPLIWGGYRWTFWQAAAGGQFKEYWTANGNLSLTTGAANSDQALILDGGTDPWIWRDGGTIACPDLSASYPCSTAIAAEASIYTKISVDMNRAACYSNPLAIYFVTDWSPQWGEDKVVYVSPGSVEHFHVNMAANGNWRGIIKGIRIDPSQSCNPGAYDPIYIGNIALEHSDHATVN
jgi:murein DD-endopeptidase MepM/ murein hydrolase activator NlpD